MSDQTGAGLIAGSCSGLSINVKTVERWKFRPTEGGLQGSEIDAVSLGRR
jgi:hypothetical protein